jgi:undecaprenyl-diphosphatase
MLQFIAELDGRILLFIQEFLRFEWLNPIVLFLTSLGNAGAVWILLTALLMIQKKYQKAGISMAISLLLGFLLTNVLLKNWVCRPRPYVMIPELDALVTAMDWSFPSGHSTSSMAAAAVMFCRMPRKMGIPAMALAVLICLSRLYVGVHYPSDVICGAGIGVLAAVCALRLTRDKNEKLTIS